MEKNEIVDLILEEAHKIEDVLNNYYMDSFAKLHNINPEHNMLNLKQEVVASKGFFPGPKKKYSLRIINNKGVATDEYDIKGLITQRSDYPEITKRGIKYIIDLLLDEKTSFVKIRKYQEKMREKIMNLALEGNKKIARPVSFSKSIEEYKKIPSHVESMLFWNKTHYNYFVKGTKGYQFKVLGFNPDLAPLEIKKNIGNLKIPNYIVIPYEEEKLPEYFQPDVDYVLAFCWDDRVKEFLNPVWKKIDKNASDNSNVLKFT